MLGPMASRILGSSLVGRAGAGARCSPPASHATAATSASARAAAVSLTQMCYHAAFTSGVNNGDAAPATRSDEEDRVRTAPLGEEGPLDRAAEKAEEVGRKVKGAAEEVKEAGRIAKDQAKEVGEDVKESIKQTRP